MNRQEAAAIARAAKAKKAPPLLERFWSKVDRRSAGECWPWTAAVRRKDEGYGAFYLDRRHQPASKVAWLLTFGAIDPGLVVCHRCDNPRCCNPQHLFVGTPMQNDADRVAKGRQCRGSKVHTAVLDEGIVLQIRDIAKMFGTVEAARMFGFPYDRVYDVHRRNTWRHL